MQALIDACAGKNFPARINVVISNVTGAPGLERAQKADIKTATISHKDFKTKEDFENEINKTLKAHDVELVCLAGFMRILTAGFIANWPERLINIHPSLLPDYKGLHTHERVLADGRSETGCTVHYVVPEMDSGPIIIQKQMPVVAGDTASSLAARVLEQEHIAYPQAVRIVAEKLGYKA